MRKQLIAGNWKMNGSLSMSEALVTGLQEKLDTNMACEVLVCPPHMLIPAVLSVRDKALIKVGAQNMHHKETGAFTGETSPTLLKEFGCEYVILGHSERRDIFLETDELIQQKTAAALSHGITPILCVGESLAVREEGEYISHITNQLTASLGDIAKEDISRIVIAYEPIWAIGTGKTATAEEAEEVCQAIRSYLQETYGEDTAARTRILYGGSVKGSNAKEILHKENIDGALVGGASLEVQSFLDIIEAVR